MSNFENTKTETNKINKKNKDNPNKVSKEESLKKKNSIHSSNQLKRNNSYFERNKEEQDNINNFSLMTHNNANKSIFNDVNKLNQYKSKISKLEKEIEKEKNMSKLKSEKNREYSEIQEKILICQKQIKLYIHKNNKQREQLQLLSHEIDQKLELLDFKAIKKQINKNPNDTYENKTEKEIIDLNIESRQKQLQNIISLIEILENENQKLLNKIRKAKNTKKYYDLIEFQKKQEIKINDLIKEIKIKKTQLIEHSKCNIIKTELNKKLEAIKEEINLIHDKNTEIKKKLDILEYKNKEKEKLMHCKPVIMLKKSNNINNSINFRNNSLNLKINSMNLKSEKLKNIDIDHITNSINKKEKKKKKDKNKNHSKSEGKLTNELKENTKENNNANGNINNTNNDNLETIIEERTPKKTKTIRKQDSFKKLIEDEMINIPNNISEIFREKELKAILIGLDKNIIKFKNLLRKFNVQNTFAESLEAKHKLELKNKLNKINELDEKIEFLNVKRDENEADIQLYQKQIDEEIEKKNIYNKKNEKMKNQIQEKKKVIKKKKEEIEVLKNQYLKIKKLIKSGDLKSIRDETEIEVQYLDEDEENNIIPNKPINYDYDNNDRNAETPKTEGTRYEEDKENNFNTIVINKKKNRNKYYPKEEYISEDNSYHSSKSL